MVEDATSPPSSINTTSINPQIYFTLFVSNSSLNVDNENEVAYENRTNFDYVLKHVPSNVNLNLSSTFDSKSSSVVREHYVPTPSVLQEDSQLTLHVSNETFTDSEIHSNDFTDNGNVSSTTSSSSGMSSFHLPFSDSSNSKSTPAFISSLWSSLPSQSPTKSSRLAVQAETPVTYSTTTTVLSTSDIFTTPLRSTTAKTTFSSTTTTTTTTTTAKDTFPQNVLHSTISSPSIDVHRLGKIKPTAKSTMNLLTAWRVQSTTPTIIHKPTSSGPSTTPDQIYSEMDEVLLNTSTATTMTNSRKVVNNKIVHTNSLPDGEKTQISDDDDDEDNDERNAEDDDDELSETDRTLAPSTQSNLRAYFDFRRQCAEEYAGDVWWNHTYGGVIAVRFCPNGYTGKVYRMCYYGGNWGDVDFSECRVQQLIKLKHLVSTLFYKRTVCSYYEYCIFNNALYRQGNCNCK